MSTYDRHWLDYLEARVDGDNPVALMAIRRAAELVPDSKAVYNLAYVANRLNRPQEALDALLTLDPEQGEMRGWGSYWSELRLAYLALDEHEKALEVARRQREIAGIGLAGLVEEGCALAGLGRVEEINTLLEEMMALPRQNAILGGWMTGITTCLHFEGHVHAARVVGNRIYEWLEALPPEAQANQSWRSWSLGALWAAGRCSEGHSVAKALSEEFPEDIRYRGATGVMAACAGDRGEALQVANWLDALDSPYLRGTHTRYRYMIAAELGDGENAVSLWKQALAEGYPFREPYFWDWIAFESIRDHPPFQEFVRQKG